MNDRAGLSEQFERSTPWPLFVALGLVLAEFGIFFGGIFVPVGVGGIVLFETSVVGILRESGYADRHWTTAFIVGVVVALAGAILLGASLSVSAVDLYTRGVAVGVGGLVAILASLVLFGHEIARIEPKS